MIKFSETDFYDPILHQQDHMQDHIGFRINKGDYSGVSVKIPIQSLIYFKELKDYSFDWFVFGNNHNIDKEKFNSEEFTFIIKQVLDDIVFKIQFQSVK